MRVMCVNTIPTKCCNSDRVVDVPAIGDIDVVITEKTGCGVRYYILEKYGWSVGFDTYHFAPLSNIDETELIKERQEYESKIS